MKTADYLAYTINRLSKGYVFTHDDIFNEVNNNEALIKALNRMAGLGNFEKLSQGKYYKPELAI
ncbi:MULTISPECIES: hypothetical protein [Kaistella]|uniref:hypothetical protein n=1 Tax=Kaistella TaxID=2782231 RepID=UPI001C87DCDD|nr:MULTISPECIES: hypothetical protein [Kaistella]